MMGNAFRRQNVFTIALCALVFLTLGKFLWPLFVYSIPLGYDVGIYRYLFTLHAQAWPPFTMGPVEAWAREHPLGLFMFTSPLLKLGVPVDWFIGWVWNVFAAATLFLLAYVTGKNHGKWVGVATLLAGILSVPYYDGFASMYWKTLAAFFWVVLTFFALERGKWWWVPCAVLALITHHQTGLLFVLALGTWWLLNIRTHWSSPRWKYGTLAALCGAVGVVLAYLPVWQDVVLPKLQAILTTQGEDTAAGAFPDALFYVRTEGILLAFGAVGLAYSIRRKKTVGVWELSVLWALVFVVFRLFFYRRFFLQMEFFLLPFVGLALVKFWEKAQTLGKVALVVALCVQGISSWYVTQVRTPNIDADTYALVERTAKAELPADAFLIVAENRSATWFAGWLPQYRVAGPGLFSLPWPESEWEQLLYGTHRERMALFQRLPTHSYFVITPIFRSYYGEFASDFLNDSCLHAVEGTALLEIRCPSA